MKEVAPYPTPQLSSYWKRSLLVTLDYGRQLYIYLRHIYAHIIIIIIIIIKSRFSHQH